MPSWIFYWPWFFFALDFCFMKKVIRFLLPVLYIINIFLVLFFRQTPQRKLWKGYSVLYVKNDISDNTVINALIDNEVREYTSLSNQYLPTTAKSGSLEVSMINFNPEAKKYLTERNNYFFDKSKNYRLYYVSDTYKKGLSSAIKDLKANGVTSGIDSQSVYPVYIPVICLLIFFIFVFFARNRFLFVISSCPLFVFALSFPYSLGAISVITGFMLLFIFSNIYNRDEKKALIKKNMGIVILSGVTFVSVFLTTIKSAFFFILTIISVLAAVIFYINENEKKITESMFQPVMILKANQVSIYSKKERFIMPVVFSSFLVITLLSIFSIDFFSVSSGSITLPASFSDEKDLELPDLSEYAKWHFEIQSFPYRSLNNTNQVDKNSVFYPSYKDENGNIITQNQYLIFSSSYENQVLDNVDNLPFPALEKVIKSQGEKFTPGFKTSVSQSPGIFSIILMLFEIILFLILYLNTVVVYKKRGKK